MAEAYSNPGLLQGTQPTHIESAQGDVFILGSQLLQDNPQLLSTYFKQAGYPMTTLQKIRAFGFGTLQTKGVEGPYTAHYEKPRPKELFTVGSIIGSTGRSIEVALSEDDMVTDTNSYGETFIFSRPRVSEVWKFGTGSTQYRITEKDETTNPHQVTLFADRDVDPTDEIIEGSIGFYVAPAKGEGTDQIAPLRVRQTRYQNSFWILDETDITSGSHMTTAVKFNPVPGSNLLWLEGIEDMEMRHEEAKGKVWMFADQANGWTDYSSSLVSNVPIPGTQGLLPYTLQNGLDMSYDPDDFSDADIRAISNYYNSIRVNSTEIMLLEGYGMNQKIETYFSDKYQYNWVIGLSDRYMADKIAKIKNLDTDNTFTSEGLMVDLGITGFSMGNYTFLQTASPEFDYSGGAGAVGYSDWLIAAPFGRSKTSDNTPYLGYEYRGTPGYSRENEVWTRSGAGSRAIIRMGDFQKTIENDSHSTYLRSEIAPHFALGEQFVAMHPQTASS